MNNLGLRIRELREQQNLLLRQVAAFLEIDTALLSKIERGERKPSKQQLFKMADFLKANSEEFLTLWLADKIETTIAEEPTVAYNAMKIASKKLEP